MGALYVNSAVAVDKHHFWERTIDEAFGAVDMKIADESNFFGEMSSTPFGVLELTQVVCDYEIATRTRRHIAHDFQILNQRLRRSLGGPRAQPHPSVLQIDNGVVSFVFFFAQMGKSPRRRDRLCCNIGESRNLNKRPIASAFHRSKLSRGRIR